jgi:hypothetical protein
MVAAMEENPKFMIFQIFEAAEVGSSERFLIFRIKRDNGLRTRSRLAKVGGRDGSGLKKDPKCLYFKSGGEKRKEEGVRKEKMEGDRDQRSGVAGEVTPLTSSPRVSFVRSFNEKLTFLFREKLSVFLPSNKFVSPSKIIKMLCTL